MIRTRHTLLKEDLFKVLLKPEIGKIEMLNSKNKGLTNDKICSVYLYHRLPIQLVNGIFAKCKGATLNDLGNNKEYHYFTKGIGSAKTNSFISACNINKLIEIQQKTGYSFDIPKKIIQLSLTTNTRYTNE